MNPLQIMQQAMQFKQQMTGNNPNLNPRDEVQKLLNSGKVNQQAFEQARNMASMLGFQL